MKSENQIKQLAKDIRIKPDAVVDERILTFAEAVLAKSKKDQDVAALRRPSIRRTIMKSPITKLAVAALVAVACLVGLSLWTQTGSGIALADVLAQIEQIKVYKCQMSASFKNQDVDDKLIAQSTMLISQTFGTKTNIELHHPFTGQDILQEIYVLPPKRIITTLMPNEKKYSQMEFDEASFEGWQEENDPRVMVRRILECEHVSLGRSTIDGIEVEGFQTTDPNYIHGSMGQVDIRVWVDVKTKLPVLLEMDKHEENNGQMHIVVCDFQWDVAVDAAEFEPVIPDDYTPGQPMLQILPRNKPAADEETAKDQEAEKKKWATKAKMGMKMLAMSEKAVIDEEAAIKGLKLFAELGSGYPETLDIPILVNELARLVKGDRPSTKVFRETIQEMTDEEVMNYKLETAMSVQGLGRFYQTLVQDKKEPAYYGKSVTPEDADQVLMRWKISNNEYRVIFGNLHAETVTADTLTELEKLLLE